VQQSTPSQAQEVLISHQVQCQVLQLPPPPSNQNKVKICSKKESLQKLRQARKAKKSSRLSSNGKRSKTRKVSWATMRRSRRTATMRTTRFSTKTKSRQSKSSSLKFQKQSQKNQKKPKNLRRTVTVATATTQLGLCLIRRMLRKRNRLSSRRCPGIGPPPRLSLPSDQRISKRTWRLLRVVQL
jgi:hypothetical protein